MEKIKQNKIILIFMTALMIVLTMFVAVGCGKKPFEPVELTKEQAVEIMDKASDNMLNTTNMVGRRTLDEGTTYYSYMDMTTGSGYNEYGSTKVWSIVEGSMATSYVYDTNTQTGFKRTSAYSGISDPFDLADDIELISAYQITEDRFEICYSQYDGGWSNYKLKIQDNLVIEVVTTNLRSPSYGGATVEKFEIEYNTQDTMTELPNIEWTVR